MPRFCSAIFRTNPCGACLFVLEDFEARRHPAAIVYTTTARLGGKSSRRDLDVQLRRSTQALNF
jgi:hypothetical protein